MNRALSQIYVSLPVDSGLFPNHLVEDKFARALRLALSDIHMRELWQLVWEAVTGSLDQAGKLASQ